MVHFLRTCRAASSIHARTRYESQVTRSFEDMSELQQCAFILGCVVSVDTGEIIATQTEDLASRQLVESLLDNRCAAMTGGAALDLTENINNVRRRHPSRGAQGVGAHDNARPSN